MSAGLSCGSSVIKYLLFIFNFVFALCGLLLVVLGALSLNAMAPLSQIGNHIDSSAIVLIVAGAVIFIIAFYGCCGAVQESSCMLITFAVLLLVIIIVEVIACVLAFMYSSQAQSEVTDGIRTLFEKARQGDDRYASEAVDYFQSKLQCCGADGPSAWGTGPLTLRPSCCGGSSVCTVVNAYPNGCRTAIADFLKTNGKIVGGVAIGVAVVELVGVWFALGLAGAIKKAERGGQRGY